MVPDRTKVARRTSNVVQARPKMVPDRPRMAQDRLEVVQNSSKERRRKLTGSNSQDSKAEESGSP